MPSRRAIARDVSDLGRSRRTNDRKNSDPRNTIVRMPVRKGRVKTAPWMRAREDKNKAVGGSVRKNKASIVRRRFVREDRSKDGQSLDRKDRAGKSPPALRLISTTHQLNLHRPIRHRNNRMRDPVNPGDAVEGVAIGETPDECNFCASLSGTLASELKVQRD